MESNDHSTAKTGHKPKCVLLNFPAELRNKIYEDSLLEDRVPIHHDLKPPALLSVSRQIRAEALPVWHSNLFALKISNCDIRIPRAYTSKVIVPLLSLFPPSHSWRFMITLDGNGIEWERLLEWCHAVHMRLLPDLDLGDATGSENMTPPPCVVVRAALNVAVCAREMPWEVVTKQLEGLKAAFVLVPGVHWVEVK